MKRVAALFLLYTSLALYSQQAPDDSRARTAINPAPVGTWERIGPEGGAYIRAMAASPANSHEMWALTSTEPAQVFRTTDGGLTWSWLSTIGTGRGGLSDIAVDPTNPAVIYALGFRDVFRSADGGLTWSPHTLGNRSNCDGGRIAVCSTDPALIYVCGAYTYDLGSYRSCLAVFKSTDGGTSWSVRPTSSSPKSANALSLALDPANPDIIYVGGYEYDGTSRRGRIYKSMDGGVNWMDITGVIRSYVYALAIDPTAPSRLYAGTDSEIYRSLDGGLSWLPNGHPASAYELTFDHLVSGTIYAGAKDTCYKSTDFGQSWTPSVAGPAGTCASLISTSAGLFFGSSAGIDKSADGGTIWQESDSGILTASIAGLTLAPSSPNMIFAGVYGKGLLGSSDYGNSWSRISDVSVSKFIVNPQNINELLGLCSGYLSRSVDGGATWNTILNTTVYDFAVNRSDFNRIFVIGSADSGSEKLYKTTDGGTAWSSHSITLSEGAISVIDIDPVDDNTIYAGGYYWKQYPGTTFAERIGLIYKSTDGGFSWTTPFYDAEALVKMIEVDPTSPNRIFVGADGSRGGFFKSENYGTGWQFIMSDKVVGVQINPAANNEVYIAVHNEAIVDPEPRNGVWATTDGGSTWQQMTSGLTMSSVGYLTADWNSRILYAGTYGGGIFRTFLPGTPARPTISGTVTTAGGQGMPDVHLTFSNAGGTVTTDTSGYYVQPVPAGWSGTVTPAKAGHSFTPADRSYSNVTANIGGEDYVEYIHTVSVPVSPNGLSRGEKSVSYAFASGGATCAQGHGVEYQFDWSDGSASGWSAAVSASHSWSTPGAYAVKVQARCSVDTIVVSDWSEGTNITILDQYTEPDKHAVGDFDGDGLDEAAVDFGSLGVWLWNGGPWSRLTLSNPEHLIAGNLDGDGDDEIVGDFGSDGIWEWNGGSWAQLSSQNSELMIMAKIDGDAAEELIVDLGSLGIWMWNGGSWNQLAGVNPEYLAAANTDGDIASELAIDFGPLGFWLWNAGIWAQLTEDDPEDMVAGDTDRDARHEIVVDFGTLGCWLWDEGTWRFLSGDNPECMTMVPAWGANQQDAVAVDFGSLGIFRFIYDNWYRLSPDNPDALLGADVTGNGYGDLIGDFGAKGLWLLDSGTWTFLTNDNPQYLTVANTDGGADQELLVDFGPLGLFLWNNNVWMCLTDSNPE